MPRTLHTTVLHLTIAGILASPAAAQDVDAMARWTAYEVVHYHFVGEYADTTKVLISRQGLWRAASVRDRVEIDFDWNQQEMALASAPVIKNFPTTVGALLPVQGCPPARVDGAYEMATVSTVADQGGTILRATSTRTYPGGAIPNPGDIDPCGTTWDAITASTVAFDNMLQVPPAMMLAMPGAGAYAISPDGKSMRIPGGETGVNATGLNDWSWTITPTPVK